MGEKKERKERENRYKSKPTFGKISIQNLDLTVQLTGCLNLLNVLVSQRSRSIMHCKRHTNWNSASEQASTYSSNQPSKKMSASSTTANPKDAREPSKMLVKPIYTVHVSLPTSNEMLSQGLKRRQKKAADAREAVNDTVSKTWVILAIDCHLSQSAVRQRADERPAKNVISTYTVSEPLSSQQPLTTDLPPLLSAKGA